MKYNVSSSSDINGCHGQCRNGATCKDGARGYHCQCAAGFVGTHCEIQRNKCDSRPCLNGGRCHPVLGGFVCECPPEFAGQLCEIPGWSPSDACDPNPCENEAKCHSIYQDFYCACPEGYEGKTCERLKENCRTAPCQVIDSCTVAVATNDSAGVLRISSNVCGPRGRCISGPAGNFTCVCDPGFSGIYCHESESGRDRNHEIKPRLKRISVIQLLYAKKYIVLIELCNSN
ncbi:hypothetical protein F2P81_025694 [Scophthalmus maximus]|uniref:EGF-like domain-containing protein n=1 Tax=Scophthalmus maximus TaxID=52904 RepID=A0A6A4RJL2_SCOMX|nr:hypothetical protein F2P81_025694 [Scophthalmus maximus]